MVAAATRYDNEASMSLALRAFVGLFSYTVIYTKVTGTLLNGVLFLVTHRWYVLAMTCSVVVLLVSAALLSLLQWMFNWQGRFLAQTVTSDPQRIRRSLHVEDDDDLSMLTWAKAAAHCLLVCILWTIFCWVNVRLDYALFWHQYSTANPVYNMELYVVNALQALPILLGAAYAVYHLAPSLFASVGSGHPPTSRQTGSASPDEYMQSLLS